jgi:hypothetical protein
MRAGLCRTGAGCCVVAALSQDPPDAAPYPCGLAGRPEVVERTPAAALRCAGETEHALSDVVLIADDDKDIVRFVALNPRLEGFDVVAVHDGREALAKALDMQPASSCSTR